MMVTIKYQPSEWTVGGWVSSKQWKNNQWIKSPTQIGEWINQDLESYIPKRFRDEY